MDHSLNCFELLKQRWLAELAELDCAPPEIFFCHRSGECAEHAGRFAGFQAALERLSRSPVPVLILGFQAEAAVRSVARAGDELAIALLDMWPGAEYLRYDVSPDELRAAARRVTNGAREPFPEHLSLRNQSILLQKLSSEIRHWLENRRTIVKGMSDDFRKVMRGDTLSPFHLLAQPAVSEEHRKMLERMWALGPGAAVLAPAMGGIAPLRSAMDDFESAWADFDAARAKIRQEDAADDAVAGNNQPIPMLISRLEKVSAAISVAIDAAHTLDTALKKTDGNDGD